MKMQSRLFVVGVLLLASPANAAYSLKMYNDARAAGGERWGAMRLYLLGANNAYGYANALLLQRHQPPLFCAPDNLNLKGDNVIDFLDDAIRAITQMKRMSDDTIIDGTLLQGLMAAFPCKP
jgi:hypothetical protein